MLMTFEVVPSGFLTAVLLARIPALDPFYMSGALFCLWLFKLMACIAAIPFCMR